ncbi:hypothetical protein GCM10009416_23360 [Craurococcus roseus]|uniref:Uncharacterized protein n=1 Tax=Craurococcus roseus TaxID=77585 RepID=A0ABP3QCC7_9PROT
MARSTVQPKTLPPKITGGTSMPDLPRLRFRMACRSFPVGATVARRAGRAKAPLSLAPARG